MMKKFFLLSWAILTALSFSSCSKDDNGKKNDPDPEPTKEIRYVQSMVYQSPEGSLINGNSLYFEYDEQHRLTKYTLVRPNGWTQTFTLTYMGNTIKVSMTGSDSFSGEFQLNSQGYVIKDHWGYTYEYDKDGYLKRRLNNDGTINSTFTQQNGNLTSSLRSNWAEETVTQYFYSSTKNLANFNLDDMLGVGDMDWELYLGLGLFGKNNTNLLTGHSAHCDVGNNFTYDIDKDGYVTAVHGTYLGYSYTKTITYYK